MPDAKVVCADGKVYQEPEVNAALTKAGPVLTDDEIEVCVLTVCALVVFV